MSSPHGADVDRGGIWDATQQRDMGLGGGNGRHRNIPTRIMDHLGRPMKRYQFSVLAMYTCMTSYYAWCLFDDAKGGYLNSRVTKKRLLEAGAVSTGEGLEKPSVTVKRGDVTVRSQPYLKELPIEAPPVSNAHILLEIKSIQRDVDDTSRRNKDLEGEVDRVKAQLASADKRREELKALAKQQKANLKKWGVEF